MSTLGHYLDVGDVTLDLQVRSKERLFREIGLHLEDTYGLSAYGIASALMQREHVGSTVLGCGVAIPHAVVKGLERIWALYARLTPPLPFDGPDEQRVTDVIVLLVPSPGTQAHLDILAQVASLFSDRDFRQELHRCELAVEVKNLIDRWPPIG